MQLQSEKLLETWCICCWQPAKQGDKYISPSEPQTGSNKEVEQDMFMLHSDSIDDEEEVDAPA